MGGKATGKAKGGTDIRNERPEKPKGVGWPGARTELKEEAAHK